MMRLRTTAVAGIEDRTRLAMRWNASTAGGDGRLQARVSDCLLGYALSLMRYIGQKDGRSISDNQVVCSCMLDVPSNDGIGLGDR